MLGLTDVFLCVCCLFANITITSCFCNVTYNSTDVIVKCDNANTSNVPKNVTILFCNNNKDDCNARLFCNRDFKKLRVIDISKNSLQYLPQGCFSSFVDLEHLIISNNQQLGFDNMYNAFHGLNKTKIKQIHASNVNQVMVIYPYPRNISTLLTNTSLKTFHVAYNEIQTLESGSFYLLPMTLQDLSIRGNRFEWNPVFLEIASLKSLQKLDISYQCSTRRYRQRTRRHIDLERNITNQTKEDCKDKTLGDLFRVVPPSLTTLIATGLISEYSCIPRFVISRHSKLEYIDISQAGYNTWMGPIDVHPMFNNIRVLNLSNNQCQFIETGFFVI